MNYLYFYVGTAATNTSTLYPASSLRCVEQTGDGTLKELGHIARDNITTNTWHALPNKGLNSTVVALAAVGSDLYVGGGLEYTGDGTLTDLGHIARYDTVAGSWHALYNKGLNNWVDALAVSGSDLYVGGRFTHTDDWTVTSMGYVARYDTVVDTWQKLPNQGLNNTVGVLAISGNDLYVGGNFWQTGDDTTLTNLGHIARYDTVADTWHTLPNQGLEVSSQTHVRALAASGGNLYLGGVFSETGDATLKDLGNIARYDTIAKTWHALPNKGFDNKIWTLAASSSNLFVGGYFSGTGDGVLTDLGYIARGALTEHKIYLPLAFTK